MRRSRLVLFSGALACACACAPGPEVERAADPRLPESDAELAAFAPGTPVETLLPVIEEGLKSRGKASGDPARFFEVGADSVWFVVIRAGERHGADFRPAGFHVVVGAGVTMPEGALLLRRNWGTSGVVDGNNEQPQVWGLAVAVEPGAQKPFSAAVTRALRTFVTALAQRKPIHPDCVVAMEEIPYTRSHEADAAERALAAAARADLPPPPAQGALVIVTGDGRVPVVFEHRNTTPGIRVGMMLRKRFDGEDRGVLFEYPHRATRHFWMKNCFIPIDLAYIKDGRIEQIETMEPGAGKPQDALPYFNSRTPVRFALEMPAGWFESSGVKVGDRVEFE